MFKNLGFIAKNFAATLMATLHNFIFIPVFAEGDPGDDDDDDDEEDPTGTPDPAKPGTTLPPVDLEKIMQRVREEERTKLYGKIKKLKSEKRALQDTNNDLITKNGTLTVQIEDMSKGSVAKSAYDTLVAENENLKGKVATLENPNDEVLKPIREKVRAEVEKEFEVKAHLAKVIADNKDSILPSLQSKVGGNTVEEIDASLAAAKEQTIAIKKELGLVDEAGNPINTQIQTPPPPVVNPPMGGGKSKLGEINLEELAKLDPRSKEYAEFRQKYFGGNI